MEGRFKLLYTWIGAEASLYEVGSDIRETRDLSSRHPEMSKELQWKLMAHLLDGLGAEAFTKIGTAGVLTQRERRNRRPARRRKGPGRGRREQ